MAANNAKAIMDAMKEDGVADLKAAYGIKIAGMFAKALVTERIAGETTPEAMALLDDAIIAIAALPA